MANPFSVDDLFTVGVSFDLLGGYLLGRGLLATPLDIARRTQTLVGANPPEMVSQIEARADGQAGLIALLAGFLLQAAGYLALIAGVKVNTGGGRAALAALLALLAAVIAWLVIGRVRQRLLRRLVVDVARANPQTDNMEQYPDAQVLVSLGCHLGIGFDSDINDAQAVQAYARNHFGVGQVSRGD